MTENVKQRMMAARERWKAKRLAKGSEVSAPVAVKNETRGGRGEARRGCGCKK
jgi:hypothetical protein